MAKSRYLPLPPLAHIPSADPQKPKSSTCSPSTPYDSLFSTANFVSDNTWDRVSIYNLNSVRVPFMFRFPARSRSAAVIILI